MTAKHRKPKNNLKNEDNLIKNEVVETEARAGGSNYAGLLVLFLMIVAVGAAGAWLCVQQHQTLTHLTDNITAMQMKIARLQSSNEEMRQSSDKHISESVENRMIALEESYALAQKQVGMALATAEQLKTTELPAQVLSLHTEMKTRMAEMQQATVSLEQLEQLQTTVTGLSQTVDVLTGSLGAAESMLEKKEAQLTALGTALIEQAAELLKLNLEVDAQQAQLKASTQEVASVRELLENELSQQASVEEQLSAVHESLQEQNSAAQSVHSELRAQLENIQARYKNNIKAERISLLALEAQTAAEPVEEVIEEEEEAATEEAPVEQEVPVTPAEEVVEELEKEEVETTQREEESQEISEGEKVLEEEEEEKEDSNPEEGAVKEAALLEEADEEEEPLENDALAQDE
ncbi:putative golgin subfamily A member 6-like protein 3 isoform X2 [Platichthys flesus]|uniref:putative golgin subfamily A member 6-like protein 3 isoform X2 n=1 Tax=Platichthys flesus TaxID=8260 RepID=UPI002DBC1BC2|nr:putative golgin subfamily A member 6-like protein 3 isoform X2 [Platichthys flesus]